MERHTLFVQTNPYLFQDEALCSSPHPPKTESVVPTDETPITDPTSCPHIDSILDETTNTESNGTTSPKVLQPSDIQIRRERQTFTRLPISGAILFTVRTYMKPLTDLDDAEFAAFVDQAGRWPDDMAAYKGRSNWWDTVLQYQSQRNLGTSVDQ
jgi:hypothetical protein